MGSRLKLRGTTLNQLANYPVVNGVRYNRVNDFGISPTYAFKQYHNGALQRFEVRQGDRGYIGDAGNGNERCEIVTADFRGAQQTVRAYLHADYWLSFAFMVEAGAPILSAYAIVGQMHDIHDVAAGDIGLSPPLGFVLDASSINTIGYSLQTRSSPDFVNSVQVPSTIRYAGTLTRGYWVKVVLRMRFSYLGAGQLQLWLDGIQQFNLSGINVGYNNTEQAAYWQYGIYRAENANTLAVRYANVEQSSNSLEYRVANPLPIYPRYAE